MQSETRRVLTRLSIAAPLLLGSAACVAGPVLVTTPSACSSLLPDNWRTPIDGTPLPDGNTVGDWIAALDAEAAQLDKANGRTLDTIGIIERCEQRDRKAVSKSRPKFLGLF